MINQTLKKVAIFSQLETQKIRVKLISELEKIFDYSSRMAKATQDEAWMKFAGYVAQVINSLANSYDEVRFNEQLKELKQLIERAKKRAGTSQTGTPVT